MTPREPMTQDELETLRSRLTLGGKIAFTGGASPEGTILRLLATLDSRDARIAALEEALRGCVSSLECFPENEGCMDAVRDARSAPGGEVGRG